MSIIQQAVDKLVRTESELDDGLHGKNRIGRLEPTDRLATAPPKAGATAPHSAPRRHIALDRGKLTAEGLLPPKEFAEQTAAEFRRIKAPLLSNAFGPAASGFTHGNLIMITSALPGAGKTFTSLNLALSMARERDHSVLLVDGDVAKPHVSRLLGLTGPPGLLEYLARDAITLEDCIVDTDVPGLAVLPAGRPNSEATELLSSKRMHALAENLASGGDRWIVLFDSPPLLVTSESQAIARLMEQIVVVVEADASPRTAVQQVIELLEPGKAINLILNKASRGLMDRYDGHYGTYYGYGSPGKG